MHKDIVNAFHEIDAALYNGDTFLDEGNRKVLVEFINRWSTKLATDPETFKEGCVICANEGPHDTEDRRHVMEGQE